MKEFYQKLAAEPRKNIPVVESPQGAYLAIAGKKVLNFCSNNYLGLANHPRVRRAAAAAIRRFGVGTGSVRFLSGTNQLHIELESRLAEFKGAGGAIALTSGYMVNLAAIQTFLGKEDIVVSDELNHASIIDAIRLAQIKNKFIYKHKDVADLEEKLKAAQEVRKSPKEDGSEPHMLIVTDGVFSMDGDLAPLPDIVRLAKKYRALTMVDDAHGEGILGKGGRGIVDHFKLHGKIDIEVGTLSKAFGVVGGFITGKKELTDYLHAKGRQFLFSNGLSVPDTAALIEATKMLEESDSLVKKLWKNTAYLKGQLQKTGFDTGSSETPITPVMVGAEELAGKFSEELLKKGVFATAIRFPMVPAGKARLRIMPSATHSKKDLDFGIKMLTQVARELSIL